MWLVRYSHVTYTSLITRLYVTYNNNDICRKSYKELQRDRNIQVVAGETHLLVDPHYGSLLPELPCRVSRLTYPGGPVSDFKELCSMSYFRSMSSYAFTSAIYHRLVLVLHIIRMWECARTKYKP